jgi:hypothetical protein
LFLAMVMPPVGILGARAAARLTYAMKRRILDHCGA